MQFKIIVIIITICKAVNIYDGVVMKSYVVELTDELSVIYEDIAKMNKKKVEDCLAIILERVIRTMINKSETENNIKQDK